MKKNFCPLIKKECIGEQCAWFITVRMQDPQSGQEVEGSKGCAMNFIPVILLENARQTRGVQQSVESHRNEAVKAAERIEGAIQSQPDPMQTVLEIGRVITQNRGLLLEG